MGLHPLEVVGGAILDSTKTLVRHYAKAKQQQEEVPARQELLFDEAFHVAKAFLERAMKHSVESTQLFGHAKVPAPPWVAVNHVNIPIELCNDAATILMDCLGEEEVVRVVGGREWWQQRASPPGVGVQAEWIWIKSQEQARRKESEKKQHHKMHLSRADAEEGAEDDYTAELDDQRCLYYIHGGGFYFGSVDIYRYTIWRYARKINGRAFALKYRLAPQYPFPCALQDALAGYLYLIRPPPGASHKPVDPKRMVIMGDSAGGGLTLSLLCLLRDMQLPLPGGGVLVSPWLDLTHSFPSILQNTATDIIPPYGFMHKPSVLWPPPSADEQAKIQGYTSVSAIKEREAIRKSSQSSSMSNLKKLLIPTSNGSDTTPKTPSGRSDVSNMPSPLSATSSGQRAIHEPSDPILNEPRGARHAFTEEPESFNDLQGYHGKDANSEGQKPSGLAGHDAEKENQEATEPDEHIRISVDGKQVDLKEQIQFYALNSQLTHPFVSPILQPSLGGLPDLLIIAGDKEVLRDESIYCAHRAARPERYHLRQSLLDANEKRKEAARAYAPTRVHLQVYDDMPHDLVLFSMASSANYAYRSIASFCKSVTSIEEEKRTPSLNKLEATSSLHSGPDAAMFGHGRFLPPPDMPALTRTECERLQDTIYTPWYPFHRPDYDNGMIRERVGIDGVVRPLEPEEELQACCLHPDDVGLIKEGAVKRYMQGKSQWDKKYPSKRIHNRRKRNVKQAASHEAKRLAKMAIGKESANADPDSPASAVDNNEALMGTWAKFDGERPPPSSIAARRDTVDALQLASMLRQEGSRKNPITLLAGFTDLARLFPDRLIGRASSSSSSEGGE